MIEKILERLEELKNYNCGGMKCNGCKYADLCYAEGEDVIKVVTDKCKEIVQEVAKEYEEKKYYRITLSCLEDSTSLEMPLTKEEYLFLTKLSELVYKVATGCMPTMYVEQKGE